MFNYFLPICAQFSSWVVETKSEFVMAWFVVAFFAMVFHGIRYLIYMIEDHMHPQKGIINKASRNLIFNQQPYQSIRHNSDEESQDNVDEFRDLNETNNLSTQKYMALRVFHAFLSALNYGLALLLMLVAMTFNPNLLVALMFGYAVGDFLYFSRTRLYYSGGSECH